MTEDEARTILGAWIQPDDSLYDVGVYISWDSDALRDDFTVLDGYFEAETLEAIAWWMKHNKKGEA